MTYFLTGQDTDVPVTTPDVKPSVLGGIGALWNQALRDSNASWQREREVVNERDAMAQEVAPRLGADTARAMLEEFNQRATDMGLTERVVDIGDDPVAALSQLGPNGSKRVIEMAREAATKDPEKWDGVDLSDEALEGRVTARRVAEDEDEAQIIAAMPWGQGSLGLVTGLGASVADVRNLPFLFLGGGGGSLLSIMGREALLNVAAEAVTLPSRFDVAKELEKPDPNVTETLLMAAGAGAVFGGAVEGLARALHYFRGRSEVRTALPGLSKQDSDLVITAVEDALVKGADPIEAMSRAMRETAPPPVTRAPLILDESMAVTPEPTALAPDPITASPLDAVPDATQRQPQVTQRSAPATKKEVLGWLKRQGVDPDGWLGTELKSRGLSNKTNRGLFRKGGLREIDNIVADELDQAIPGVSWRAGRDDTGTYLDRDGLLRLLDEEIGPKTRARKYDPRRAYADPDPEDRGWMVNDLEARKFAEPERWQEVLAQDFDAYLASTGRTLLPREREEIIGILSTRGGDAEDLVYSAMSREIDEAEMALLSGTRGEGDGRSDVPWGDEAGVGQVPDRPSGSPAGQSQTPARNAPESGTGGIQPQVERTAAGDQYVAPGIAATTERQRLEARQNARLQGGNRAADEGLFDVASRGQMDMFSDPASKEARVVQDAIVADLRDQIAGRGEPDEVTMTYRTAKGSTYKVFGDGTTQRNKAARNDAGHEGDSGEKKRTSRTVYVDENAAVLSAAGMQGLGPKGARVVIKDGKASLLWWNDEGGKWGRAASGSDIPVHDAPAVGRYPLELWSPAKDVPEGYVGYSNMHAGNAITEMVPSPGRGDVTVDLGDGKGPRTMSTIIKDLEADEAFVARLDLCGLMGGPTE